jgi:hypothetical protein
MANSMPRLMRRALAVPLRRKLMLCEGFVRVCAAWVMITLLPYRLWRSQLGVLVKGPQPIEAMLDARLSRVVDDVAWVHHALQRVFGTGFTCLMLALSARNMLAQRGVHSHLILGVERNMTATKQTGTGAHAWVKVDRRYVVGENGSSRFVALAVYGTL